MLKLPNDIAPGSAPDELEDPAEQESDQDSGEARVADTTGHDVRQVKGENSPGFGAL